MNEYARHGGATVRERWSGYIFIAVHAHPAHSNTNVDAARFRRALLEFLFGGGVGVEFHGGLPLGDGIRLAAGGIQHEAESPVGGAG